MKQTFLHKPIPRLLAYVLTAGISSAGLLVSAAPAAETVQTTKVVAKKYAFVPNEITVKKGQPTILQFTTEDRSHGFFAPDLNLHANIEPGKPVQVQFTPSKTGEFAFFCDVFCGSGHEDMNGKIKVVN
ncbi:MAG TPA: cupredoxin domain-containing protein [Oculatellaceae cyanobacterium]